MSPKESRPAPGEAGTEGPDAQELRLVLDLQHDVERVRSFERLLHVALRSIPPYLGATHAVALAPERGAAGLRIVHQLGARDWDLDRAREVLATGRAAFPPEVMYALLRERGKSVALLLLARERPFERSQLRTLLRAAEIVSARLDALAEARVVDVLARIDTKISRELRTVDLLYQILDGLELLTRYDHSAAILLFDRERSRFEVSAEKIVWRKMKSPNVRRVATLDRELAAMLQRENRAFLLRSRDGKVTTGVHGLCEPCEDDPATLDARASDVSALFELLRCGYAENPDGPAGGAPSPPDTRKIAAPSEASMLVVPLLFGSRLLGLLKLSALQPDTFTQNDVFVVGRFVEKMSTAIRNANLYSRRLDELRAINNIGKLVTRPMPLEQTCESILDIVLQVMNLTVGSIELIDRDSGRLRVLAAHGYRLEHTGLELGEGITGEVARTGKPILANDVHQQPKYVMHHPDVRSELAVPIVFEGTTWGVLNVESHAPDRFRDRDVDFLSILADKTATALETLDQREHRRATLELLHDLGSKLMVPEDIHPLLQLTVDVTRKHLCCEVASIFLFESGRFRRQATSGLPDDWFADESYASGEGLTGRAAARGSSPYPQAVVENAVPDSTLAQTAKLHRYEERLDTKRVQHLIAVPLLEGERPVGILRVLNRQTSDGRIVEGGFSDSDATLLTTIASQVSLAIANFKKNQKILEMRRRLEAQVRERTAEVHRLASFVENAPLAIFEVDPNGVLRFINDAGERMFGYQAAELVGHGIDKSPDGDRPGILGDAFDDLSRVVDFMSYWMGEIICRRSDGSTFPVFLSARAVREPGAQAHAPGRSSATAQHGGGSAESRGALRGFVMFARDITPVKELEKQLLEAEGKRAMADLAGGVAHDLNNALGSILPMIQTLKSDVEENRVDRQAFLDDLRQIERYARSSVRIFQGMLSMARGTFAIDKLVNLNERIKTALDILSLKLDKAKVNVKRELQDGLPLSLAHPGRLEQVFHNLIGNAIDAMPEGGTLTVRTWSEGESLFAEVEDTGGGIPEDDLAKVQEPFYTSKRHGTGLGLSVVRSIAWEHGGKMTMQSQVGRGTTVRIELPVRTLTETAESGAPA
jgi:PAS domain S-box-containing protein